MYCEHQAEQSHPVSSNLSVSLSRSLSLSLCVCVCFYLHIHTEPLRSERQAKLEKEQNAMMEKLNKIRKEDFDNTKRIERPEEILERRRKEREQRNVWYRRWGRWIVGKE